MVMMTIVKHHRKRILKKYVKEALKSPEVKSKMLGGGEKIPKDPTSDKYQRVEKRCK